MLFFIFFKLGNFDKIMFIFFRYNRPKYFNGTFDAFVKISRVEGVSSLWSGLSPTLVLAVPTTVVYFTTYELLKGYGNDRLGNQTFQMFKCFEDG
jgi:hypothetical protein